MHYPIQGRFGISRRTHPSDVTPGRLKFRELAFLLQPCAFAGVVRRLCAVCSCAGDLTRPARTRVAPVDVRMSDDRDVPSREVLQGKLCSRSSPAALPTFTVSVHPPTKPLTSPPISPKISPPTLCTSSHPHQQQQPSRASHPRSQNLGKHLGIELFDGARLAAERLWIGPLFFFLRRRRISQRVN
jgi:hypothetical protein